MEKGQLNLYPFFTKVYSDVGAPLRMAFKLSSSPSLPTTLTSNAGNYLLMIDTIDLPSFTKFECLIRAWSKEPTSASQSSFVNSYRSYKQRTQH